jgi:CheY-like chemotaxis protein
MAIHALRTAKPDLIVLDLMMPKLNGVDVLKFVRSNPVLANIPVIVLSNSYAEQVAGQAAAAGANKGLVKTSCSPALLAQLIEDLLEGRGSKSVDDHLLAVVHPTPEKTPPS